MIRSVTAYALVFLLFCFFPQRSFAVADVVHVFAAASLKEALETAAEKFSKQDRTAIKFSFASSSTLAKQIEAGAPADLFASADLHWMDYLEKKNLIDRQSRINLLGNELVIVTSRQSKLDSIELTQEAFSAVLSTGRLVTGEVNTVPVGLYAKSAMLALDLWSVVEPRLAQAENVRAALAFVARGEVELGIVYKTDALIDNSVKIIATVPTYAHDPIVYPFALTSNSQAEVARTFLEFLSGPEGQKIFVNAGFDVDLR